MDTETPRSDDDIGESAQLVSESFLRSDNARDYTPIVMISQHASLNRLGSLLLVIAGVAAVWKVGPSLLKWNEDNPKVVELTGDPLLCCGPKNCLLAAPDAVCGTTRSPVICGYGDIAAENSKGFGYCCNRMTLPCQDICLDDFTRRMHLQSGGTCNGEAPPGFRASKTIMPVSLPWHSARRVYLLDVNGTSQATLPSGFFEYGNGDFTLLATVTLEQITLRDNVTIYSKFDSEFNTGFRAVLRMEVVNTGEVQPVAEFSIQQGTGRQERANQVMPFANNDFQVPHEYRFIRHNMTLFIFRDGMQVGNTTFNRRIDVNTRNLLTIGGLAGQNLTVAFANMRSESFAYFP